MDRKLLILAGIGLPGTISALDQAGFAQASPAADLAVVESWAPIAIGGGRFFFCLLAGVLMAFAFQWIWTCLSLAAGISAWGGSHRRKNRENRTLKIGTGMGLWALVSACASLFPAAWLASDLIRFGTRSEAVILGLTIWAGFMLAMVWLEAAALGSVTGAVIAVFKSGLRNLASPLKESIEQGTGQGAEGADAIAARVREEYRKRGGGRGMMDKLREYVEIMGTREPDRFEIDREADALFEDEEIRGMARRGELQRVDRNRFREMLASRGDITAEEAGQWADAMHGRWNGLREETQGATQGAPAEAAPEPTPAGSPAGEAPTAEASIQETPENQVPGKGKQDAKAAGTGPGVTSKVLEGTEEAGKGEAVTAVSAGFKERLQGFKDFLRTSDRRELNPARLEQEVEILVANPEESLAGIESKARSVKRQEVVQVLKQRRDISPQEADSIADLIDSARTRTLSRSEMREHRRQENTDKAFSRLRDRVYSLKRPERDYQGFRQDLERMLEGPEGGTGSLESDLQGLDRQSLFTMFFSKQGISKQDAERMAETADQAILAARETARQIEAETRRRVEDARMAAVAQAESARKLAVSAAWWMSGISIATGAAAALGGWLGSNS